MTCTHTHTHTGNTDDKTVPTEVKGISGKKLP